MAVSHEASEIERFTPDSLKNIPAPPVFLLRAGSRRDRNRYQRGLMEEGLTRHGAERVRAETLKGLEELWTPDDFAANVGRLKAYWDAADAWTATDMDKPFAYPQAEQEAVLELIARITQSWEPLRKLGADNIMFAAEAPNIMLSVVLTGWEGTPLPTYAREAGAVTLDLIDKLEDALTALERQHSKVGGVGKGGTAFMELCAAAGRRMFLSEAEEKNSSSPPPSLQTPVGSKGSGKAKGLGSSRASASSKKTPATSSATAS